MRSHILSANVYTTPVSTFTCIMDGDIVFFFLLFPGYLFIFRDKTRNLYWTSIVYYCVRESSFFELPVILQSLWLGSTFVSFGLMNEKSKGDFRKWFRSARSLGTICRVKISNILISFNHTIIPHVDPA